MGNTTMCLVSVWDWILSSRVPLYTYLQMKCFLKKVGKSTEIRTMSWKKTFEVNPIMDYFPVSSISPHLKVSF